MTTIAPPMARAGPAEWLLATDHKRTALRIAAAALVFFVASGALALLMRSELAQPGLQIVSTDTYNQLFTMLRHRAPGMDLTRLSPFSWSMFFTCLMSVTAFPVLVVAMGLLFADRHLGPVFDTPGGPVTYQHLFWFYGHPVVYVMFFPFVGAVAEVVATFSRRRFFGYQAMVFSLLVFAALSMSVWAHHMFTTGQVTNQYFALTSTAIAIPA